MNLAGLSFDRMPPFHIPMRFFMTAAFFGIIASLLFLIPDLFVSRWQPVLIALTHVFTLGFIAMVMLGALTQVLPVLGGKGFYKVETTAPWLHFSLVVGILAFVIHFLWPSRVLWVLSGLFLIGPLVIVVLGIIQVVINVPSNHSLRAVKLAAISLVFVLVSGGWQLASYYYSTPFQLGKVLTDVHLMWGLLGWITLLIMGVSFQVIPMFHVTPEFPRVVKRSLPVIHFIALLLLSSSMVNEFDLGLWIGLVVINLTLIGYACLVITLLLQRQRKITDATVLFWWVGSIALIVTTLLFDMYFLFDLAPVWQMALMSLFIFGFVISIILGMLLKIIPFLAFMHLQQLSMKSFDTMSMMPSMSDMMDPRWGLHGFRIALISLIAVMLSFFWSAVLPVVSLVLMIQFSLALFMMITVYHRYNVRFKAIEEAQLLSPNTIIHESTSS